MTQQDLIGFFNPVPHDRILQALTYTLFLLQGQWGKPWQEQSLQLSFRNKTQIFGSFEDVADLLPEILGPCTWRTYQI